MTRRSVLACASACLIALVVSSCGSRVVPLSQATDQNGVPIQPGLAPSTAPLASTGPSAAAGRVPLSGAAREVAKLNQTCAPPAAPTDQGVTQTTIRLGEVVGRSGPLPGAFDAAWQAADSYFRMINDLGGICRRKIDLRIRDDGESGPTDLQVATDLASKDKVFAFVASTSAPNDSGVGQASVKYKLPDIGFSLTFERSESKYTYGVPGQLQKNWIGTSGNGSAYLNRANNIKQIAIFWVDESPVSRMEAWAFEAAMQKTTNGGFNICYEQPTTVLDSSFTQYVVNMQSACKESDGNIAVYTTMENNNNIKLAQAMRDQNFKPKIFVGTFQSYQRSFIDSSDGATEGTYIPLPQIPFERLQAPQSSWTPGAYELKRYLDALHTYHPEARDVGSFGPAAWGAAELFTRAATACGADLTRTCVFHQLDTMGPYSDNGFLSPTPPSEHNIYTLETMVQVKGSRFVEVPHDGMKGPAGLTDFWMTESKLFNWWDYYCANKGQFKNTQQKDRYITCR